MSLNPNNREYTEDTDQIREVLIHSNYLSQKAIERYAAFDITEFAAFPAIESLHQTLRATYTESKNAGIR